MFFNISVLIYENSVVSSSYHGAKNILFLLKKFFILFHPLRLKCIIQVYSQMSVQCEEMSGSNLHAVGIDTDPTCSPHPSGPHQRLKH